jgi:hypothetical protein
MLTNEMPMYLFRNWADVKLMLNIVLVKSGIFFMVICPLVGQIVVFKCSLYEIKFSCLLFNKTIDYALTLYIILYDKVQ